MTDTDNSARRDILVWDWPVRVFHWLMVLSFAGAWLSAESERWRLVHVSLGYTMAALVTFRLLWGLVGSRHARFASFVRGPRAVLAYLKSLPGGHPEAHTGHNPAGAVAVLLLLGLTLGVSLAGWAAYNDLWGNVTEELHEGLANFMLLVVAVHVAGVLVSSVLHRENLVRAMFSGHKQGRPDEGIPRSRPALALAMLVAVLGFWWLQWADAPPPTAAAAEHHARHHDGDHDED
ncbi:cytochrome b [Burkholderiales bacterium JOSHI_001]|nr:cytochrome b [Burkholderiales bacterium JOSHI_001]